MPNEITWSKLVTKAFEGDLKLTEEEAYYVALNLDPKLYELFWSQEANETYGKLRSVTIKSLGRVFEVKG